MKTPQESAFNILETFLMAIQEVGLSERTLFQMANELTESKYDSQNFNEELETTTAIKLADILCIDMMMLQYGYRKQLHRNCVGRAIHERGYTLPMNKQTQSIYEEFKNSNLKYLSSIK